MTGNFLKRRNEEAWPRLSAPYVIGTEVNCQCVKGALPTALLLEALPPEEGETFDKWEGRAFHACKDAIHGKMETAMAGAIREALGADVLMALREFRP